MKEKELVEENEEEEEPFQVEISEGQLFMLGGGVS